MSLKREIKSSLGWLLYLLFVLLIPAMSSPASAQPTLRKTFSPDQVGPGNLSVLTFTIGNSSGMPVENVAFTDDFPTGLTIAAIPGVTNTCGGVVSAVAGGTSVSLTDGIAPSGSCSITVNVTAGAAGTYSNTTGELTSSAGNSQPAADDLIVDARVPSFTKSFSPSTITEGTRTRLTFTIDNSMGSEAVSRPLFTDVLPSGLVVANPANIESNCCGTVTAIPGSSVVTLNRGNDNLNPGGYCTFGVDIIGNGIGTAENITGQLMAIIGPVGGWDVYPYGQAYASLERIGGKFSITKDFIDDPGIPGDTATLSFTINNRDRFGTVTNIAFTDDLDDVMPGWTAIDTPLHDVCGTGSTLTGGSTVALIGGSLAPASSCTFNVTIRVPDDAAPGRYLNTTSAVTGDMAGSPVTGNTASEYFYISPAPKLEKVFSPAQTVAGEPVKLEFTITNTSMTSGVTDIAFNEELVYGMVFEGIDTGTCNGSISWEEVDWDVWAIVFSGGSISAPGGTCTESVSMKFIPGAFPGAYYTTPHNISGAVDGTTYTGNSAPAVVNLLGAPFLNKSFTDDPVMPGGQVTLEFTIYNHDSVNAISDITFTDDLDGVLVNLAATGLPKNGVCGAGSTLSGTSEITLSGGSLEAKESCSFSVTLHVPDSASAGVYNNTTSDLTAKIGALEVTGSPGTDDLIIAELNLTKEFTNDPVLPGDTVNLRLVLTNSSPGTTYTGVTFMDSLSDVLTGLTTTSTGTISDICNSGSRLTLMSSLFIFSGGAFDPGESCTIDVSLDVPPGAANGTYLNNISSFSANAGSTSLTLPGAVDMLEINNDLLNITKTFTDDLLPSGGAGTLKFIITNLDSTRTITGITFTDDLDAALSGLEATGLPAGDVCGVGSEINGTGLLTLTGGSLAPGASCTFSVDIQVPSGVPGGTTVTSTTGAVSGLFGALPVTGATATDDLTISDVAFTKSFGGPVLQVDTTTLSFYIENKNSSVSLDSLTFSDDLDSTLPGLVAVDTPLTAVCGPGSSITGTSTLTLNRGSLAPGESCSFEVTVQTPFTGVAGDYTNTTSALITDTFTAAEAASAVLTLQQRYYTISGTLTDSGTSQPIPGATVFFSNDGSSVTTGADGRYTKSVLLGANTTVTPDQTGYASWSPPTVTYDALEESKIQNFSGTLETYTISGQVTDGADPLPGVTLAFSHDNGTTQTDGSGNYSYTVDHGTTTTVTPSKTGYAGFSPSSATFTSITGNEIRNFTGAKQTFTISGQVTDGADPIPEVTLTFDHNGDTIKTDASGAYSYTVDYGATTTVTPTKTGYHNWSPPSADFSNITGNQSQNFEGAIQTFVISGQVTDGDGGDPLPGVTLTFSPDGGTTQTDAAGNYSYAVDYGATTTVTPSKTGYAGWAPADRALTHVTSDQSGQDFACTLEIHDLTVIQSGEGEGVVTSDPAGIDCGSACTASYDYGTTVTLTAAPGPVDFFDGWSGSGCSGAGACQVLMEADQTVTAAFSQLPRADLAVTKETNTYSPSLGGHITFIIRVTNNGPEDAAGVMVTDVLPAGITYESDNSGGSYNVAAGVWTIGNLADGETVDLVINALYDTEAVVTNTAQITNSATYDPNPDNDAAGVTIDADADIADLSVWKLGAPKCIETGGKLVYFISVGNLGPAAAVNVELTDAISTDIVGGEYKVAGSVTGYASWPGGNVLSLGTLDPLEFKTVWVRGRLAGSPTDRILANTADAVTDTPDQVTANNSSTDRIQVLNPAPRCDLSVVNSVDKDTVLPGDSLLITVTGTNNGPDDAASVQAWDLLPHGLTYQSDNSGGAYNPRTGGWQVGSLATGASATLNITTEVNAGGLIGHLASIGSDVCLDPNPANNFSTFPINGAAGPDLALWSEIMGLIGSPGLDETALADGDRFTYVLQFENNGPAAVADVQIQVTLPMGVAVVAAAPGSGCYDSSTNIWHVDDPLACIATLDDQADAVNNGTGSTLTLTLQITDAAAVGSGEVTAEIIQPLADPDITNNTVTRTLEPGEDFQADLAVNVAANTTVIKNGQTGRITVIVRNNGPDPAGSVQVLNQMPAALTVVSSYPSQGNYRSDTGIWMVGNLAANAAATLELIITPAGNAEPATFSAEISGVAGTELNTANNGSRININVQKAPGHGNDSSGGCFVDNLQDR